MIVKTIQTSFQQSQQEQRKQHQTQIRQAKHRANGKTGSFLAFEDMGDKEFSDILASVVCNIDTSKIFS